MKRRMIAAALASGLFVLLAGCGLQSSGVEDGPSAPTGIAPGTTLYFLDADGSLTAQQRETGRLGTVSEAVSLLLTGPGDSGVRTGIDPTSVTRTEVTVSGERLVVRVPISSAELTADGIDQIACTALASLIQAGGPDEAMASIEFTDRSEGPRACPVFD
ncbi:GerMN domain-containing protein [Microbacterium halotolerans]|uniref:GerMN domain-containing protein n=1 Tax=Microbacterium halotolerans TaxID=246613 RepID=UPI000E6AC0F9|nr:GerMN domain-containing protein [Microbacterium halotolerans]